ncbi:hypothetical protein [Nocardia sp. NPDC019395]|uniref:hypothetical protein n=1 Tax=Nocardia sp. NPDC019395 TaxID=3154686 RepID=UPI0033D57FDB
MFRRSRNTEVDPLLAAELADRVQVAHDRLAHQDDPALVQALSQRELDEKRRVAERVREHGRREEVARLQSVESAADQVRRATAEIVRADADDLVTARKALAEQRREASPHAQLAHLYRIKKWSGRALAGVVVAAMLWSAVNVQQNIAPTGAEDPLFWASYLLEALISTVLVVFMISGSAVARWKITEGEDLIRRIEVALLVATVTLNTYPYFTPLKIWDIVVHAVAPVMIGVALFGHDAVGKRLGAAIEKASAQLPPEDDITTRLEALTTATRPAPTAPADPAPAVHTGPAFAELDTAPAVDAHPAPAPDAHTETGSAHAHHPMRTGTRIDAYPRPVADAHAHHYATEPAAPAEAAHPTVHIDTTPNPATGAHPDPAGVHVHPQRPATPEQPAEPVSLVKPEPVPAAPTAAPDAQGTRTAHAGAHEAAAMAVELVRQGATTKPAEEVTEVLARASAGVAPTTIARETGLHHRTVAKILSAAEELRRPRVAAAGGQIIELDRRAAR